MVDVPSNDKEIDISSLKLDFDKIQDKNYIESLDKSFDKGLNQVIINCFISDLTNNISNLSNLSYEEKKNISDLILSLWKHDKKNDQVHTDDNVYENLIYNLYQGTDISDNTMKTKEIEYNTMKNFSAEVRDLYLNFLENQGFGKGEENNQIEKFKKDVFTKSFIKNILLKQNQYNNTVINEFCQKIITLSQDKKLSSTEVKNKFESLFKELDKNVDFSYSDYQKEKNNYQNTVNKQTNDRSFINAIAQVKGIDLGSESNGNYKEMRKTALIHISNIEKVAGDKLSFGKDSVLRGLYQAKKNIETSSDSNLSSVIQNELQKAKDLCGKYPNIAGSLLETINTAFEDPKLKLSASKSPEKQSQISWQTILESGNQSSDSFVNYVEKPEYKQAYNDAFDIMAYTGFTVGKTMDFRGQNITVKQEHIDNFLKLIKSQLKDSEFKIEDITLSYVNKESGGNAEKGKLSFYPSGMRVIIVPYTKEGKKMTGYVTFGDTNQLKKDLAKGFEDIIDKKNISDLFEQIPEVIDDTNREKFGDYVDDTGKLVLDAHGGPEALKSLFKKGKIINYLKEGENLQKTFDTIFMYGKNKGSYCLELFEGIKGDEQLMRQYSKLILSAGGDKYLGPVSELLQRQNIVLGLVSSPFFNKEKDTELFILLSKEAANLKNALSVAPTNKNKNMVEGLQSQIEGFAKMIINSPLWAGIITLLDSVFGKGGLMKKLGEGSALSKQLDKQFKDKYAITGDQRDVIDSVYKLSDKTSIIEEKDDKEKEKIIAMGKFKKEEDKNLIVNELIVKPDLLDAKVLSNFFVLENGRRSLKTDKLEIDYSDIFEIKDKKEVIKSDVDKEKLSNVLSSVVSSSKINSIILETHMKLKHGGVDYGKSSQNGIQSMADYSSFATAFLMGGSKSDGGSSFHYVITETNMPNERQVIASENNNEKQENKVEDKISEKRKNIGEKIEANYKDNDGLYNNQFNVKNYQYNIEDNTDHYQSDVLIPLSDLFIGKTVVGEGENKKEINNFDFIIKTEDGEDDSKKINIHIKNMLLYIKGSQPSSLNTIDNQVFDNFDTMIKMKKEDDKIIFSDKDDNRIELSLIDGKLNAKYIISEPFPQADRLLKI